MCQKITSLILYLHDVIYECSVISFNLCCSSCHRETGTNVEETKSESSFRFYQWGGGLINSAKTRLNDWRKEQIATLPNDQVASSFGNSGGGWQIDKDTGNPAQDSESEKEEPKKLSLTLNRFVRNCTSKFRKDILFESAPGIVCSNNVPGIGIVHFQNFFTNKSGVR